MNPHQEKRLDRLEEAERLTEDEVDIATVILQARYGRPVPAPEQPERLDAEAQLAARFAAAKARMKPKGS